MLTLENVVKAANALHATQQYDESIAFWEAALAVATDDPVILTGATVTLRAAKQLERAETSVRRAIEIEPNARRRVLLACAVHDQGRLEEAEAIMREARRLDPDSPDANWLLALWLLEKWHFRETDRDDALLESLEIYETARRLLPDHIETHISWTGGLIAAGKLHETIAECTRCIEKWPNVPEFHVHRAAARMKLGQLVQGYSEFGRWAYRMRRIGQHPYLQRPAWDPRDESQREAYVWNVEGAGDYFQFIRFAQAMADDGYEVKAICNRTMDRLIARVPGVSAVVTEDTGIAPDAVLASLPMLPAEYVGREPLWSGPYMTADPQTIAKWRDETRGIGGFRVGIAWAGNPDQSNDARRSFDVGLYESLWRIPDVTLIALQKGRDRGGNWIDLGPEYDDGDWLDTAGVIANLDLVIAPCTAVAHLAGAMGKPVWLALSEPGCWRWMEHRSDSPWYPSMRIFRQSRRGSWDGVFEAMAGEISSLVRAAA